MGWSGSRAPWLGRLVLAELVFLAVFTEWYASRYFHWGFQLPFGAMVGLILACWAVIAAGGWLLDRRRGA